MLNVANSFKTFFEKYFHDLVVSCKFDHIYWKNP